MRTLPSVLKLPIWVNVEPSEPTVMFPILMKVTPFEDTLMLSDNFVMVSPLSDTAMFPKMFQKDMLLLRYGENTWHVF